MTITRVDVIRPAELSDTDRALWSQWVAENPDLSGPYFDVRYVVALGETVPHARIAKLYADGYLMGFLPFQKRGGVIQPLGAPLTDFHGVIAASTTRIDIGDVLSHLKSRRIEFNGWVSPLAQGTERFRLYADLSNGFDAQYRTCYDAHKKFYRNTERCRRNLHKDVPDLAFTWETASPDLIDWVVAHKRRQYKRTGLHDVFACGWTQDMLNALSVHTDVGFGLMAGVYRHKGQVIAAEIVLRSGPDLHLWFPAYDSDYSRYGPGILLSLDILKAAAQDGITRVDFGCGDEIYKATMTTHRQPCREGYVQTTAPLIDLHLKTRVSIIRACETRLSGQVMAGWQLSRRVVMKTRKSVLAFVSLLGLIGGTMIAVEMF
ncbi:GNAT family N-acetyltransferase [Asticcacaulis sp. BYS171W]|uniref:GNAT family N-acetyltransferase n=1 Tax=Asticcacaulis aquaticus TaxID=2984212 RepID=A0ABT5HRA6_9CAUL|nr:GNAT family N-acetyltransferase [Asticcacaulis aquaticus]MDC7681981.1 GNAT family N-acetyltransferase [Asticcacaulis aquaticus]